MIKVHGVMAEGFLLKNFSSRETRRAEELPSRTDIVTISEEGKKRRIFGHVMASISEPKKTG